VFMSLLKTLFISATVWKANLKEQYLLANTGMAAGIAHSLCFFKFAFFKTWTLFHHGRQVQMLK